MFSNGDPWSVQLANRLKLNGIPVSNYSVGGATVIFEPKWVSLGLPYSLGGELMAYKADSDAKNTKNNLAIFFLGSNDYLTAKSDLTDYQVTNIVNKVTTKIKNSIQDVGATKTILIGLPDLSVTPESRNLGNGKVLSKISLAHNKALMDYANLHSANVKYIHTKSLFDSMVKDTAQFNEAHHTSLSTNENTLATSCWSGGYFAINTSDQNELYKMLLSDEKSEASRDDKINDLPLTPSLKSAILAGESGAMCHKPQQFIFWDHVHPTYQVHKVLYQYILHELNITSSTIK